MKRMKLIYHLSILLTLTLTLNRIYHFQSNQSRMNKILVFVLGLLKYR